ncbi:MAG: lactoylglutathione lyase [Variovorax sp.]|jgi:catechol 2,3-dioxygenase-like lactoylglutathione lyase family enzyme|nr:lactoylglutathione lyase [Variovorax sp.]
MYAHIQLGVSNLRAASAFYDAVLGELGLSRFTDLDAVGPAGVIWRQPTSRWPQFVVNLPLNGEAANPANGSQVSFLATTTAQVDAAWAAALANGGVDAGRPGFRERYARDFYAAYCTDPEGHKLCFACTAGDRVGTERRRPGGRGPSVI